MSRELLRQALDALTNCLSEHGHRCNRCDSEVDEGGKLCAALRSALEAPEPEPVAHLVEGWHDGKLIAHIPRLTLEDAKASAAVFSQHYTTTKLVPLYAAPPAAPAEDHATPSGGQEAGPQEDRIEAAYWRFDARRSGYARWKAAPMSERDAFKAEMRNALEAEKVRAEMRLVARGWRRPARVPLTDEQLAKIAVEDEFLLYCDQESFNEIARAIEAAHGIGGSNG